MIDEMLVSGFGFGFEFMSMIGIGDEGGMSDNNNKGKGNEIVHEMSVFEVVLGIDELHE